VVVGPDVGISSRIGFISLRVVRNSCHVPQNAAAEASPDEVLLTAGLSVEAGVLLGAELPQADSASASAAANNGVASSPSRPVLRVVCSMAL
jgi:hypothetical protein